MFEYQKLKLQDVSADLAVLKDKTFTQAKPSEYVQLANRTSFVGPQSTDGPKNLGGCILGLNSLGHQDETERLLELSPQLARKVGEPGNLTTFGSLLSKAISNSHVLELAGGALLPTHFQIWSALFGAKSYTGIDKAATESSNKICGMESTLFNDDMLLGATAMKSDSIAAVFISGIECTSNRERKNAYFESLAKELADILQPGGLLILDHMTRIAFQALVPEQFSVAFPSSEFVKRGLKQNLDETEQKLFMTYSRFEAGFLPTGKNSPWNPPAANTRRRLSIEEWRGPIILTC